MRQILHSICVCLVINNLKNRAEHVLGRWNPNFFAIFYWKCSIITDFQNSPKNPLIPHKAKEIHKFAFFGKKSPKLATLLHCVQHADFTNTACWYKTTGVMKMKKMFNLQHSMGVFCHKGKFVFFEIFVKSCVGQRSMDHGGHIFFVLFWTLIQRIFARFLVKV
jgi:hypothetical protein